MPTFYSLFYIKHHPIKTKITNFSDFILKRMGKEAHRGRRKGKRPLFRGAFLFSENRTLLFLGGFTNMLIIMAEQQFLYSVVVMGLHCFQQGLMLVQILRHGHLGMLEGIADR